MRFVLILAMLVLIAGHLNAQKYDVDAFKSSMTVDPLKFADPPNGYRQHPWMTFNLSRSTEKSLSDEILSWAEKDNTGGFYLGLSGGNTKDLSEEFLSGSGTKPSSEGVAFLSSEYFDLYAKAIEAGLKNGIPPIVFYDEVGYPSGIAGGLLYSKYPQHAAKSLEMIETDISGPAETKMEMPEGIIVGAVMMNLDTRELKDLSPKITNRLLECDVPPGRWKVMGFFLDPRASLGQGRKSGYVDYLDKEAVKTYISLVYQPHYDHLKKYFGTVLKITHYDEPALHVTRGRAWTPKFNEEFRKVHGYDPMIYYPALFYDIGPNTAAIRNALWGFRAKLFSENYIKQLDDWCRAHNIMLSGHFDQEEITNPVPVNGDLMLAFKHQQVPGIDDIWWWGRNNRSYKLVTSAMYNWDKPLVMAETYAAYKTVNNDIIYKVAMDQAAMGTSFQVGALPRGKTPENDRFIGRLSYMLQYGRHVADVAILYPIHSLQADYHFGNWGQDRSTNSSSVGYAREGGIVPPETDYIDLGEIIFRGLRQDYTFLHPEVLNDNCIIRDGLLVLNNKINYENYRVLIIPGSRVLSVATAKKIKAFHDAGGTIIATRVLADKSTEPGMDSEVRNIMGEVFGMPADKPMTAQFMRRIDEFMIYFVNRNDAGGKAYFLPDYTPEMIQAIMREAIPVWDVNIEEPMWPARYGPGYDGSLTYIHKVKDSRNIYFISNSSDKTVETNVVLRDSLKLSAWNPLDGKIYPVTVAYTKAKNGQPVTSIPLKLDKTTALFLVEDR